MKAIISMTILALLSMALAGCWGSSPDTATGCARTAAGAADASGSCPPSASPAIPPTPPPIPRPGML